MRVISVTGRKPQHFQFPAQTHSGCPSPRARRALPPLPGRSGRSWESSALASVELGKVQVSNPRCRGGRNLPGCAEPHPGTAGTATLGQTWAGAGAGAGACRQPGGDAGKRCRSRGIPSRTEKLQERHQVLGVKKCQESLESQRAGRGPGGGRGCGRTRGPRAQWACGCSTRMEQHCPGGLTQKEELILLLSRSETGEEEKESAEKLPVSPAQQQ